jgi:hypothetical protein
VGWTILDETHLWIGETEITPFIRTGKQAVTVVDGQVVFAETGEPWRPGETGIRVGEE